VEVVVNGIAVANKPVQAEWACAQRDVRRSHRRSSWIAVRIAPAAHTNQCLCWSTGKPIRASRRSAEWCLASVNQCWTQKGRRDFDWRA